MMFIREENNSNTEIQSAIKKQKMIPTLLISPPSDAVLAARFLRSGSSTPGSILSNGINYFATAPVPPRKKAIRRNGSRASSTPPSSPSADRKLMTTFSVGSSDESITSARKSPKSPIDKLSKKRDRPSTASTPSSIFNKNDKQYRCCCGGLLHIRHGALLIGVVECLLALANMIGAVCLDAQYGQRAQPMRGVQTEAYLIISVLGMSVISATVAWMAYAAANRRRMKRSYMHLLPHLVVQMLTILTLASALIILAVLAFHAKNVKVVVDVFVLALLGCGVGLEMFFFALVLRCYHYLKDEYELSARAMPTCVQLVCSVNAPAPIEILYQPTFTFQNVDPNEYCVY